jgi:signal transduction histidine kinase/ActR/RegA family two-component response regulator
MTSISAVTMAVIKGSALSKVEVPSEQDIINALADDLPVAVWVARAPMGEEIYTNREFGEIMGQHLAHVRVGEYSEPYGILKRDGTPYPETEMPFVRALVEKRVIVADDIMIRRPDTSIRHVRATARPVEKDGVITHVIIAFIDTTREVEAEKAREESELRLRRAQRLEAIGTLAGGIAHDFNNLIFGIKLLAAELAAHERDPQRLASLRMIDDVTERSAMLTRSLLGFARRGKHRTVPVALNDLIEAMRELLVRTLTGIQITFELEASARGTVIGDASQLEQVVMNLVVNARDAVRESGGHVIVRTRTVGDCVVLEVVDDGPGIPAELRDRVFEPYFTTKTQGSQRGTGLGLATVFGIAESHGGSVEVDKGIGTGAMLRVSLPAAAEAAQTPRRDASAGSAVHPGNGTGTILVVDDDRLVRRAVANTLRSFGYHTFEATNGEEAVRLFREHRQIISAVVLDMIMPGLSGSATFAAMREIDPDVAVLLMSGYSINDDVQGLIEAGASGFVTKPYSPEVLAQSLAAAIEARPHPSA